MKSIVLATALVVASSAQADMILSTHNFESFTAGALTTDATGVTAGQGGWYTYTTATSGASNWAIESDPMLGGTHGNVLRTTGGTTATGNNSTRFAWNDDVATNSIGESFVVTEYDFYMSGTATSKNRFGVYQYDATGTKVLSGVTMQNDTGQLYLIANYNNAGTVGNYAFNMGATAILGRNMWHTLVTTFDSATGQAQAGWKNIDGTYSLWFVNGAAMGSQVAEYDLIGSVNSSTAALGSATGYYDNFNSYSVPAPGAIALLGLAGLISRRRR